VRGKALAGVSGGMRQRFGIAQALIGNPELIIVDEPTAGLDPEERNRFLNLLAEVGENVVIILSTHIVEDVTDLCPRMAVLAGGKIQLEGAPIELIHVLSDTHPGDGFEPAPGGLEDVYLATVNASRRAA
jgi:ABC-type multidrug transport system ATPase subunit